MTVKILAIDESGFDFLCDGETFRLRHDGELTINDGKVIDPIKGVVFERNLKDKELAELIFELNNVGSIVGDNPKRFYGVKWKFDDESILAKKAAKKEKGE